MIDMHIHSVYSDGQYTIPELVKKIYETGIKIFSITDHDTFSGNAEAAIEAQKYGLKFIPGIEISTESEGIETHILGYNMDFTSDDFCCFYKKQVATRSKQKQRTLSYLRQQGINITIGDVERFVCGDICGRPHFARAMVEKGYVSSVKEAFDKYLATSEYKKIQLSKADSYEAIDVIKKSGGTAILAHPILVKASMRRLEQLILSFKDAGLDGLECFYGKNSPEQNDYLLSIANKYNLIHTGGSDFHGEKIKPDVKLGTGVNNALNFCEYEYITKVL